MISAVILTHNDERIISRAIESVSWCDETIVIDDDSTDATPSIAKKNGSIVYSHSLQGDFSAQRNFGLSKAKGNWVLFLDSDEIVSKEVKEEIETVVHTNQEMRNGIVGYYLKRTDFMWGRELRYGETAHVRLLRLAKRESGRWIGAIHEIWDIHGSTQTLEAPLLHFPHPNVAQFMHSINTYSTANAHMLFDAKIPSHAWHVVMYPIAKFIKNYIWYLGFLDGMPGVIIAIMMSFHSFLTRGKLYLYHHVRCAPLS